MILDASRLIVVQLDRTGYSCPCGLFHRDGEPLYSAHADQGFGPSQWIETHAWAVKPYGGVVPISAAVAIAALQAVEEMERQAS